MKRDSVLMLNADYSILEIISVERALSLYLSKKKGIRVVDFYEDTIKSCGGVDFLIPSVIVCNKFVKRTKNRLAYSKKNIYLRDQYLCQYCGKQLTDATATIDHVIPKSRYSHGPVSTYENCVLACRECNAKKGDRTPAEAKMQLLKKPYAPKKHNELLANMKKIPKEWEPYI